MKLTKEQKKVIMTELTKRYIKGDDFSFGIAVGIVITSIIFILGILIKG